MKKNILSLSLSLSLVCCGIILSACTNINNPKINLGAPIKENNSYNKNIIKLEESTVLIKVNYVSSPLNLNISYNENLIKTTDYNKALKSYIYYSLNQFGFVQSDIEISKTMFGLFIKVKNVKSDQISQLSYFQNELEKMLNNEYITNFYLEKDKNITSFQLSTILYEPTINNYGSSVNINNIESRKDSLLIINSFSINNDKTIQQHISGFVESANINLNIPYLFNHEQIFQLSNGFVLKINNKE